MRSRLAIVPATPTSIRTTDEWEEELGRAVRVLRVSQRLTQTDLAKLANISLTGLRNLEAGRGSTLRSFILVLRALGKTDWLSALTPTELNVSPMELLRQREKLGTPISRIRVRHSQK